jgi:hypothetical protein
LYFGAHGVAGLTRGTVAVALGLLFWLVLGIVVVRWYDRKHLYRLQPDVVAHVSLSVREYQTKKPPQPQPPPLRRRATTQ